MSYSCRRFAGIYGFPNDFRLGYNAGMTTLNTIEDLARILREQPTWVDVFRSLILSQDVLDLPARLDQFIEEQQQINQEQREHNRMVDGFIEEQREHNRMVDGFIEEQREHNRFAAALL